MTRISSFLLFIFIFLKIIKKKHFNVVLSLGAIKWFCWISLLLTNVFQINWTTHTSFLLMFSLFAQQHCYCLSRVSNIYLMIPRYLCLLMLHKYICHHSWIHIYFSVKKPLEYNVFWIQIWVKIIQYYPSPVPSSLEITLWNWESD